MSAPARVPRPDVRAHLRAVVARGIARADQEQAAELARLRPARRLTDEGRRRLHRAITAPRERTRRARQDGDG